jgi:peptide/nickel transport system ATP-binding protein
VSGDGGRAAPPRGPDDHGVVVAVDGVSKRFALDESLVARLAGRETYVHAVSDVSLSIHHGETLGLVGESGSGKSTLANVVTGLHAPTSGEVRFRGEPVGPAAERPPDVLADIGMVFQNPRASLSPRLRVESVLGEPMRARGWEESRRETRTRELLDLVDLTETHLDRYPHELSGGQAQRVAIARALALDPTFLVLDEPVSALDVSIQAKILNLLMELQADLELTVLFIAHDLSVVEHIADRVAVMYLGELMEVAPAEQLFASPAHPYTEVLLSAIPSVDPTSDDSDRVIPEGDVPSLVDPPEGCVFHARCPRAEPRCAETDPDARPAGEGRSRCLFADEVYPGDD